MDEQISVYWIAAATVLDEYTVVEVKSDEELKAIFGAVGIRDTAILRSDRPNGIAINAYRSVYGGVKWQWGGAKAYADLGFRVLQFADVLVRQDMGEFDAGADVLPALF